MADQGEQEPTPDDAWIEKVVNLAGHLGFNKMRLRWKLIRWQDRRRKDSNLREQKKLHITYAHKTCHQCSAVQDKDEAVCTSCGAKLGSRTFQVLKRLGLSLPVPRSASTLIAIALLVAYARVWVAAGGGMGSPSGYLLVDFGGRWPPLMADEPWRLVTAMFLHAGLWHLAFNLIAIAQVGPRIEEIYGRMTMLGLFILTGVVANLATLQVGHVAVGIGASGGLMGLIGIAAGYGHRAGRGRGHGLRDDMIKWSAYTFIFGFAVGADNWAHLFGLLSGGAFGFFVKPVPWSRRAMLPLRILLGLVGIGALVGAVAIIMTRTATPVPDEEEAEEQQQRFERTALQGYIETCTKYYAGDVPGAIAAAQRMLASSSDATVAVNEQVVDSMCVSVEALRTQCATDDRSLEPDARASQREMCDTYKPMFTAIPPRLPKAPAPLPADAGTPD